ncbi:hypothetical protein [uncultured Lamprocystis sp.]|uniref:hypothetical protein n=1 Tax=uncultured Lamprocystis sp. TaxID=543132 RepID=UPI0025D43CB2|nr:hypothetical protein [uncultured Lamprocystis sp.]
MPKKPSKTQQAKTPQPEPAQFKAIERLLRDGDYQRAVERTQILVQRFPDHGGANHLLLQALERGQSRGAATLAAYHWAERRPRSPRALETLFRFALAGHHLFLANRVADQLRDLGALAGSALPDIANLDALLEQPDGSRATRAQMEQFDIGKLYLEANDFAGAVRALDGLALTSARNNRAVAFFHQDRIAEALACFLDAWQHDQGNLFALGWALRLRLYQGDETGVRALVAPLAQVQARRVEDAYGQLSGLLLIREDQAAWEAFAGADQAAWINSETDPLVTERLNLGAGAASRLGQAEQAAALWRQTLERAPHHAAAEENLAILERDGGPPAHPALFNWTHVLPIDWVNRLRAADPASVDTCFDELSATDTYLEASYLAGDSLVRFFATQLLKHRLTRESQTEPPADGQPERRAATILRDLARLPVGTEQERLGLLRALRECGLVGDHETVQYWGSTAMREARLLETEIYRQPDPPDLPEDLQALLDESVGLIHDRELVAAEACVHAVLGRVPDHQAAMGNLAAIRSMQGRDAECRDQLRRTITAHPDYLFARVNLAGLLIEDGDLEEAKTLLSGLGSRPRLHIQEAFALYGVLAMLNRATGEYASADALIASLEGMVQTDEDRRLLATAKARVARASRGGLSRRRIAGPGAA